MTVQSQGANPDLPDKKGDKPEKQPQDAGKQAEREKIFFPLLRPVDNTGKGDL